MLNHNPFSKRLILIALAAVFVLTAFVPAMTASAQGLGSAYVTAYYLNVRSGPGPDFSRITTISRNEWVSLVGRNAAATWAQVQLAGGYLGWVNARYIQADVYISNLPVTDGSVVQPVAYVVTDVLNVRSGPAATYSILTAIGMNTAVTPVGRNYDGSWVQVVLPGGAQGWVNARYLSMNIPVTNLSVTWAPRTHVVQRGETLFRIARLYGVTMNALAAANGITNYNVLYAGQVLIIP